MANVTTSNAFNNQPNDTSSASVSSSVAREATFSHLYDVQEILGKYVCCCLSLQLLFGTHED